MSAEETIRIGCPVCGSILTVKNQPGIESKRATCPVCGKTSSFASFKRIGDTGDDEPTQYPFAEVSHTLGRLCAEGGALTFQLRLGANLIGRKASGSSASIQLPCPGKRTSREHLVVEAREMPGRGLVHYVYINKEQVNPTYIGNCQLEYGDRLVLNHNDIIKLPDMELRFELPDEEGTEL